MPQYSIYIYNQQRRIRYPRRFDLPDLEAVRKVALRTARVFMEAVPYWTDLSPDQQNAFVVEIVDETGQTVLTVPFSEAGEPKP